MTESQAEEALPELIVGQYYIATPDDRKHDRERIIRLNEFHPDHFYQDQIQISYSYLCSDGDVGEFDSVLNIPGHPNLIVRVASPEDLARLKAQAKASLEKCKLAVDNF